MRHRRWNAADDCAADDDDHEAADDDDHLPTDHVHDDALPIRAPTSAVHGVGALVLGRSDG